ncbi:MAG TPA: PQQ-binding-like beta-propeller repeat protein, partial [Trueperaceae bacterium]|nr:PQQ-binding-like beta-propeller repeat protein [Trueperaceae bacterium]
MKSATRTTSRRQGGISVMLTALIAATILSSAFANSEILRIQRDAGQVPMANVNYAGWNYSPLDRINTFNVNNLEVKWTFQLGVTDSLEAPPIVIGNTMYILTPKPNTVYALDLANEGYLLWSYRPEMPGREQAIACCG